MTAGPEEIARAVARLRAGGLVAFPTETVYGLGADAMNPAAIEAVFTLKGRPSHNPLIVHVADERAARALVSEWPAAATALARAFWPGPLTIVLPKSAVVPDRVTARGPTVAIRCPSHHVALALLSAFGGPLVGPSANPSGRVSPTTAEHVRAAFSEDQVLVLDGGPCRGGIESTVVSLAAIPARVLRPGLISAQEIAGVIGRAVEEPIAADLSGTAPLGSPGQLPVHYAPLTRAALVPSSEVPARLASSRAPAVVLGISDLRVPAPHVLIPMPRDAAAYASRLYAALREADALKPSIILIERPPESGPIWDAVSDRLRRATA